ncbi:glycoside hydrolase family 3 C-terminal domain-containing protein [Actinospica durhamensis]|uniref:Glycoside hydrolase family 3 C-terminal domain-containing protein n=1 Tax=Actinospica durhamensis TaxID=1508375 RepID=A0A941IN85_9ACTN|nr:glycoside hydrolase family 3 C-terminal domain-containing protein [Actinospica durhamensis]MBR7831762.1 glycoside hydrolase family 3 C-terminal domain-containing protein [Actinospica durhamensis]
MSFPYPGSRRRSTLLIALAATSLAVGVVDGPAAQAAGRGTSGYPAGCPWMDTHLDASTRANLLLAASSLDQKLRWLDEKAANSPDQTSFTSFSGTTTTYPAQVPCTPTVVYADSADFVRNAGTDVTVYPSQVDLAATWSSQLAYAKGKAEANDAFESGHNVILGPDLENGRTVLDGRTPEDLGEDSLLGGTQAAAQINGLQNGNADEPVMAVLKHYVANEQEANRNNMSANMTTRTLEEVYNQPFNIALSQSSPGGIMCSYNQINGAYACENPILDSVLKGQDGFQGYVTSDFFAVHSTAPSLNAGLDQELNNPIYYTPANIQAALDAGQVTMSQINEAAFRVVRSYIASGLFDHPMSSTLPTTTQTAYSESVAEQVAQNGSVLLKNSGQALPLGKSSGTIAVIGQTASATPTGGVSAQTVCTQLAPDGMDNATDCPDVVAPLDSITSRAAQDGLSVTYDNGSDIASAVAAAKSAKTAVVFAYAEEGEGADRTSLSLDGNGDALIEAVAAANPNTVVILETGSAVAMPWLGQVKGVVEAWYPGEQQGTALAKLLFGDADFTGRLPITFPASLADTPTDTTAQYPGIEDANGIYQVSYSEGLEVGYKWYEAQGIKPLFPFGYGLSYTDYSYSGMKVTGGGNGKSDIKVSFTVRNDGTKTGTVTPQLYVTQPSAADEPGHALVGYQQITLKPGQSQKVTITVDPNGAAHPISYYDTSTNSWVTAPGTYTFQVGSDSQTAKLSQSVRIR